MTDLTTRIMEILKAQLIGFPGNNRTQILGIATTAAKIEEAVAELGAHPLTIAEIKSDLDDHLSIAVPIGTEYANLRGIDEAAQAILARSLRRPDAAPARDRPDGWRPIDTAPKDGTVVLLYWKGAQFPYVGSWRDGGLGEPQPGLYCWRSACSGRFADSTHWQPLPPTPDALEGK